MLLAAIALLVTAQDAPLRVPERGAGVVVMLGARIDPSAVPELSTQPRTHVSITSRHVPPKDLTRSADLSVQTFELSPATFRAADDRSIALAVRSADRVTFGDGSLREWYVQLFPNRHKSELVHALLEARRFGTTIVGRGDSAALLAGATVVADERELGQSEGNPHKLGLPRRVWGMGYEPRVIVDMESRSHGNLARLVDVMLAEHFQLGAWIADDAALVGDLREEKLTCRGTQVVVLDLRGARHVQSMLLDAHLSILRDGDAWIERSRALETRDDAPMAPASEVRVERETNDVFDAAALCGVIAELAKNGPETIVVRDARRAITLTFDTDSTLISHASTNSITCSRARLDVQFER